MAEERDCAEVCLEMNEYTIVRWIFLKTETISCTVECKGEDSYEI